MVLVRLLHVGYLDLPTRRVRKSEGSAAEFPKEFDGVTVIDAQRVRRIVVVDSIAVIQKTTTGPLLLPDIVLPKETDN